MSARTVWGGMLLVLGLGCGPAEPWEETGVEAPDAAPAVDREVGETGRVTALAAGDTQWVRTTSGGEANNAQLVRVDEAGNSYTVLGYGPGAQLQGRALPGGPGIAVVSHTSAGSVRWLRTFTCTGAGDSLRGEDLWVTPGGRSVLVLNGVCSTNFGGGSRSGRTFIVVLGSGGQHRWSRAVVPLGSATGEVQDASVTVNPLTQQVLVAGNIVEPTRAEGTTYTPPANGTGTLLLRYTDQGTFLGATARGTPGGTQRLRDVVYDSAGRLNALFDFTGTVDFGDGPRSASGGPSLFVARYRTDGSLLWARQYNGNVLAFALAVGSDRVVVVGDFVGELSFRGQTYRSIPDAMWQRESQGFVMGLSRLSGSESWLQLRGRHVEDVAINGGSNVVVIGRFLGVGPVPPASELHARFVAKYDRITGRAIWRRVLDFDGFIESIGVSPGGRPVVCGNFREPTNFGTGTLTPSPAGSSQAFIVRFLP